MTIQKKCKECGHEQHLKFKRALWRCSWCLVWNKMRVIPLAILMTFTLSIGLVYAVEVEIPYENFQLTGCSDVDGVYTCQWMNLFDEIPTDIPTDIPEETVEEITEEEIVTEPEVKLTREERTIQRMIDKITTDLQENPKRVGTAERQLLDLLTRAQDECYFGIEQGAPIQQYALFPIPKGSFYLEGTDLSTHKMLGDIAKLVEACVAWDKYRFSHLGQQYLDIAIASASVTGLETQRQLDRQEFVDAFMVNITQTDEWRNAAISAHDILEEEEDAADFMCSMEGQQRGLCSEFFYGMNRGGYVDTTDNPILSKYLQYRAEPESAVGEPRYDMTTNAKCAIMSAYVKQYELGEEARDIIMKAAGCKI